MNIHIHTYTCEIENARLCEHLSARIQAEGVWSCVAIFLLPVIPLIASYGNTHNLQSRESHNQKLTYVRYCTSIVSESDFYGKIKLL